MTKTRLLTLLVLAVSLPLGACYAEAGPAPGYYGGRPAPPSGYRTYEWHAYGHVEGERRR